MTFKTYSPEDREYLRLKITADILSGLAQRTTFKVEDTYWDLGAGLVWTTIIAYRDDGASWQALNPREHEMIINATDALNINAAVSLVLNNPYAPKM
jgi:hypothetical protein